MKRRSLLAAVAGLPLLGRLVPAQSAIAKSSTEPFDSSADKHGVAFITIFDEHGNATKKIAMPVTYECTQSCGQTLVRTIFERPVTMLGSESMEVRYQLRLGSFTFQRIVHQPASPHAAAVVADSVQTTIVIGEIG